jgi:rare lipoprotein A
MRGRALVLIVAATVAWSGCARGRRPRAPLTPRVGRVETGVASWYGEPYHGRRAANGEVYDMEGMTAAHRTFAFETWVRVENLANGRSAVVRITDRGPFVSSRIIDLSRAAARAIDMIGPGTAKVRLIVIKPPGKIPAAELFAVQIGAFADRARAERLRRRMEASHRTARLVRRDGSPPMWRVLVGAEPDIGAAGKLAERLRSETGAGFVVRLDEIRP